MATTSIHIEPVKPGSEIHNSRGKDMEHIRQERTALNCSWRNSESIAELHQRIKSDYQSAHGKKLHAKATPVREAVVVIQEDTTIEQIKAACEKCRQQWGIEATQIYTHLDEGHDEEGQFKCNAHAHIVFNWYDFTKHCTCKLTPQDMAHMQTIFADALQMERGQSSDKKHLSAIQQKTAAEEARLKGLQAEVAVLRQQKEKAVQVTCANLQQIGKNMCTQFDRLGQIVKPTKKQQEKRDALYTDVQKDASEYSGTLTVSLHRGIDAVAIAIQQLTERIVKLAKQVPLLQLRSKRLAHEATLQADRDAAIEETAKIKAKTQKAQDEALLATQMAKQRAKEAQAKLANLQRQIDEAKEEGKQEGRQEGASAKDKEWRKWFQTSIKPAIDERDKLKDDVAKLKETQDARLQDLRIIADRLTALTPDSVALLEKKGIREAVGIKIWDEAKRRHQQQHHQQTKNTGMHR